MSWLVWRLYRGQAAVAAALLAAFGALLLVDGLRMAARWHSALAACAAAHSCASLSQDAILGRSAAHVLVIFSIGVPGVLGLLWGAPLAAAESESGTGTFAWTQAITRGRWLAVKAGWLLLAAALWSGAVAALATWWSGPLNALNGDAFQDSFDTQGIVPIGYALFATALGIAVGAIARRTVVAIGVTLAGFAGVRLAIAEFLRQHYMAAVTAFYNPAQQFSVPGAWVLSQGMVNGQGQLIASSGSSSQLFNGVPVSALPVSCQNLIAAVLRAKGTGQSEPRVSERIQEASSCVRAAGIRGFITYQPASHYWPFQWIETGIFAALAAALLAVAFLVVSRRDA